MVLAVQEYEYSIVYWENSIKQQCGHFVTKKGYCTYMHVHSALMAIEDVRQTQQKDAVVIQKLRNALTMSTSKTKVE